MKFIQTRKTAISRLPLAAKETIKTNSSTLYKFGISVGIAVLGLAWAISHTDITKAAPSSSTFPVPTPSHSPMLLAQNVNKEQILAAHNQYRQEVGILPLQWSDDLARSAQSWANQLAAQDQFKHSNTNYGENLWAGTKGAFSITQMIERWGSEKQFFIPNTPFPQACGNQACGHYTQIIWQDTKEVGCGLASSSTRDYLVCQYNPPGNYTGEQPY